MSHAVKDELEYLRTSNNGLLRPIDIVEFAKANPDSALHSKFEWDDTNAAHLYRLMQARSIVAVVYKKIDDEHPAVREYVSLRRDRKQGGGYRSFVDVVANNDWRDEMLQEAISDMERFKSKYETLAAVAPIIEEMERAAAKASAKKTTKRARRHVEGGQSATVG